MFSRQKRVVTAKGRDGSVGSIHAVAAVYISRIINLLKVVRLHIEVRVDSRLKAHRS